VKVQSHPVLQWVGQIIENGKQAITIVDVLGSQCFPTTYLSFLTTEFSKLKVS